jgi:hypothetical protein
MRERAVSTCPRRANPTAKAASSYASSLSDIVRKRMREVSNLEGIVLA